jgi:hypothetical protein
MRRALTALTLLALLALAPAAHAADRSEALLIDACQDEHVDGHYTQQDYRKALANIPADTDEYTGCRDVIHRAQLAAASGNRGGSGGGPAGGAGTGGAASPTASSSRDPLADASPRERRAVEQASKGGAKPVSIGGDLVRPGLASAQATLPKPVVVLLALLAAGALGLGGWVLYVRVLARRAS